MRSVVDMPEKKANQFLRFILQNGGHLAKGKRAVFSELSDEEVSRMENAVASFLPKPGNQTSMYDRMG